MRFAKIGARMIRIGTAILLAVLASAAPGRTPPASQSEAETPKAPPTVGSLDLPAIDQRAVDINFLCHLISVVAVAEDFGRP